VNDVRVIELRRQLRLVREHRDEAFVVRQMRRIFLIATIFSKPSTPRRLAR
jgi:hypothetical protein